MRTVEHWHACNKNKTMHTISQVTRTNIITYMVHTCTWKCPKVGKFCACHAHAMQHACNVHVSCMHVSPSTCKLCTFKASNMHVDLPRNAIKTRNMQHMPHLFQGHEVDKPIPTGKHMVSSWDNIMTVATGMRKNK